MKFFKHQSEQESLPSEEMISLVKDLSALAHKFRRYMFWPGENGGAEFNELLNTALIFDEVKEGPPGSDGKPIRNPILTGVNVESLEKIKRLLSGDASYSDRLSSVENIIAHAALITSIDYQKASQTAIEREKKHEKTEMDKNAEAMREFLNEKFKKQ